MFLSDAGKREFKYPARTISWDSSALIIQSHSSHSAMHTSSAMDPLISLETVHDLPHSPRNNAVSPPLPSASRARPTTTVAITLKTLESDRRSHTMQRQKTRAA